MDLLGLGCLAMAIYLGYVIYLGWNGGTVGNGTEVALDHAVGGGSIVFPVVLALGGLGLILRPLLPSPRALAVGVFAIAAGLLLALAAQTAGFGPDGTREKLFAPEFFSEHGGALGEVLYWASTTLFQRIGAHIIAVLLVVAGVLLVMGRSVSDMIAAALRGFSRVRDGAADFVTLMRESRAGETDPDLIGTDPIDTDPVFGPPEPVDATPVAPTRRGPSPARRASPTSTRRSASRTSPTPNRTRRRSGSRRRPGRPAPGRSGSKGGRGPARMPPRTKPWTWAMMAKPSSSPPRDDGALPTG
jgi:hypothetical protein